MLRMKNRESSVCVCVCVGGGGGGGVSAEGGAERAEVNEEHKDDRGTKESQRASLNVGALLQ